MAKKPTRPRKTAGNRGRTRRRSPVAAGAPANPTPTDDVKYQSKRVCLPAHPRERPMHFPLSMSDDDCVAAFKERRGIIRSVHPFEVMKVGEPADAKA